MGCGPRCRRALLELRILFEWLLLQALNLALHIVAQSVCDDYLPCSSKYFSTSSAAMQPEPAAVMAWR